jgi:hypothetical protein
VAVLIHLDEVVIHDDLGDLGRLASDPRIERYVNKYGRMLGAKSVPATVVRDNLGVNWLGRTHWSVRDPTTTLIEIQKRILADANSLERVVAHEMIHHVNFTDDPEYTLMLVKTKRLSGMGHGEPFQRLAAQINAERGKDFVTEKSDQSYTLATESKPYILAIVPRGGGLYGHAWAVKMTPKAAQYFEYLRRERGAILVRTTDPRWAQKGPRLGEARGIGVPQNAEEQNELRKVYEQILTERKQLEN